MNAERLSLQQQRVRQLERGAGARRSPYRASAMVEVRGPLDVDALEHALRQTVAAIPGLAGSLESAVDLVAPGGARWSLSTDAAAADEHTLQRIVERVVESYRGTAAAAANGDLAYADYVEWQQGLLEDPDAAVARAYWSERRHPDAGRFRLPFALGPHPPRDFEPAFLTRSLDGQRAIELARCAKAARVDLGAWLLAGFQALLWRHLGAASVEVGVWLDGRAQPDLRDVLGPCARYVPVEVEVARRWPLAELARRSAALIREHRVWQDCFSWDALDHTGRDVAEAGHHAFGFAWHAGRSGPVGGRGGERQPEFRITRLDARLDRFDLRLIAGRTGRGIQCELEWNRCHYEERDVAGLADRYLELLDDAARRPSARVSDLEVVGSAERQEMLARARGPEDAAPADRPIHAAFEEEAARDGSRTAVVAADSRLSYSELDRRAAALAERLRAAGVGAGHRVAICLPRTAEQLVAMFGVLKLGAAFVPLDPLVPGERLAWIVEDAQASVLIAPAAAADRLPPGAPVTLIVPEPEEEGGAAPIPLAPVDPAAAAYVIYTSGSTGRPKGVLVSHRNLVHSTAARWTHYRRGVGTFLLVSPLAFDSSMAGVFWTLGSGGTLVLPADGEHNDPVALRRLVEQHGVTHLLCLPSLYGWVLEAAPRSRSDRAEAGTPEFTSGVPDDAEALRSLRVVIVAGERCPSALAARHLQTLPEVEFHNEYGPTECSVWSTVYQAGAEDEQEAVPIGRPIARTEVHVAERPWRLAPRGAVGEAVIGGAGVADGYLGRPDLTAERFVPDAWSGRAGARVYRTGDRVRWLADGQLEFLGRADHQVKVRGYRLELEEIEGAIGGHPDVRECAVAVRGTAGAEALVAYVVGPDGDAALPDRLRRFLGDRLPLYMVPGAIVAVESLPKTPNGKVDRARLPSPALADRAVGPVTHPPSTDTEKAIAALWQESLGRAEVDVHHNFFDLGGHSLLAIAIFTKLSARAPQLRLVDLFEHPTVHALAAFVDALPAGEPVLAAAPTPEATIAAAADARARQQALRQKRLSARAS